MQTFQSALRSLVARPAWALAFIAIVGGNAGAVTALLVVSSALFSEPPFPDAASIVHLRPPAIAIGDRERTERVRAAAAESSVLAERAFARFTLVVQPGGEVAVDWALRASAVSVSFFSLFSAQPANGRIFTEADARSIPRPALLGYELWRDRFGSDTGIINKDVEIPGTLDGGSWRILGVMPAGFSLPEGTNFWTPFAPEQHRPSPVPDFARLAPGISIDALRSRLPGVTVTPLAEYLQPNEARAIQFLLAASALLLLGAWTHGASLLVAHTKGTLDTVAIRAALGATPAQLRAAVAAEGVWLALGTLTMGILVSKLLIPAVVSSLPPQALGGRQLGLDLQAAVVAAALASTGILIWVYVAIRFVSGARIRVMTTLGMSPSRTDTRFHYAVLFLHVTVASSLTYASFASIESSARLSRVELGFEPHGLLAVPLPLPTLPRVTSREAARATAMLHEQRSREAANRVLAMPGVAGGAFAATRPLAPLPEPVSMTPSSEPDARLMVRRLSVTRGYVTTIGARLIEGREPTPDETQLDVLARPISMVAVVNESLARHLRPYGPVVGQTIGPSSTLTFRIVGVIRDVMQDDIASPTEPIIYSVLPDGRTDAVLLVRLGGSAPTATIDAIRQRLPRDVSSGAIVNLEHVVEQATAGPKARAAVLGILALLAVVSLAAGLLGSVVEVTRRKQRAIAIRLAVGATAWRAVRDSILPMYSATASGLLFGLALGVGVVAWAGSVLYGVQVIRWTTAVVAAACVGAMLGLANTIAARRVSESSCARVLKEES